MSRGLGNKSSLRNRLRSKSRRYKYTFEAAQGGCRRGGPRGAQIPDGRGGRGGRGRDARVVDAIVIVAETQPQTKARESQVRPGPPRPRPRLRGARPSTPGVDPAAYSLFSRRSLQARAPAVRWPLRPTTALAPCS